MSTSRTYTAGQVLTAAQVQDLPQGVLRYSTSTSNSGSTSGTTETDMFTANPVTISQTGRRLRVSWYCRGITGDASSSGDVYTVRIKEGSTILAESNHRINAISVALSSGATNFWAIVDNPSAASHTYKVTMQRALGGGTAVCAGSSDGPMTITVEDIGSNS